MKTTRTPSLHHSLLIAVSLCLASSVACDKDDDNGGSDNSHADSEGAHSEGAGSEGGSHAVPSDYEGEENPNDADDADVIAAGEELFGAHCAVCHGEDGTGIGGAADLTDSHAADWADDFMFWKISDGVEAMPAFKDMLSEDEIWEVITYCRTLSE